MDGQSILIFGGKGILLRPGGKISSNSFNIREQKTCHDSFKSSVSIEMPSEWVAEGELMHCQKYLCLNVQ